MDEQINSKEDANSLGIKELFYKYVRFIPLFILSIALALALAFGYLRWATRIYYASGNLLIKSEAPSRGGDKFEDLLMSNGTQNIQSEIEVLKSRPLMERVIKVLGLQTNYFVKGRVRTINIYKLSPFTLEILQIADSSQAFTLRMKFANDTTFHVNDEVAPYTFGQLIKNNHGIFRLQQNFIGGISKEYEATWQPVNIAAGGLAGGINVAPKTPGTGILILSTESTNPALSADIINQLMIEYQGATIEDKNVTIRQTLQFIDDRLEKLEDQLDSVEKKLLAYRLANNIIDEDFQTTYYNTKFTETDKQINDQTVILNFAEMIEDYMRDKKNYFNIVPSPLNINDPTLLNLIQAYNRAQLERKAYYDGNGVAGNPIVQMKEAEISKLRQDLLENLANLKKSIRSFIGNLEQQNNSVQSQIKALPEKVRSLLEIKRQKQTKETIQQILLQKREETAISEASTISNSKIIEKAFPNGTPIKPNRRSIQLIALLLGIALPGLFIFLKEMLNDRVSTRGDIEKITNAPILGEIGHSFTNEVLVVTKASRSMVAEQFRIIRSNLQYVLNKVEKPVIMVSSSFSGEGKSFISINMGAVMALAGKKTVILEFDIRKPKILSGLGLPKKAGITNFLVGKSNLDELPVQVPGQENLYVIGCGPVPPNPSELLLDQRVHELFDYLHQHFDVVIIDTAPVGMVSDAMTLGKFANSSLYIVRQGHTYKKQIHLIDEFYTESKLPKISIVLNDVKIRTGYGYYGYGRYGYGKGYGSGYYEEEAEPTPWYSRLFKRLKRKR